MEEYARQCEGLHAVASFQLGAGVSLSSLPADDGFVDMTGILSGIRDSHSLTVNIKTGVFIPASSNAAPPAQVVVRTVAHGCLYLFTAQPLQPLERGAAVQLSWPERVTAVNRRRHRRVAYSGALVVTCTLLPEEAIPARAIDISQGGMGFRCAAALPVGTGVRVHFLEAPFRTAGTVEAVLRRCNPGSGGYEVGCEFVMPDSFLLSAVDSLVLPGQSPDMIELPLL